VIRTDLDLASSVSKTVGEHYKEGVEFTTALPSYALICYRKLLEEVCELLGQKFSVPLKSLQLKARIDRLKDAGKITFGFNGRCQKLRILCNPGAHRSNVLLGGESKQELIDGNEDLLKNALEARQGVLWILEHTYRIFSDYEGDLSYSCVHIETQEWKEVLFSATTEINPNKKFKAGLWCEAEAKRRELAYQYAIATEEFQIDQDFLRKLAASFYYASYKLEPNIEAGFRYAKLIEDGKIDGDKKEEAQALIESAAKGGHGEACDYYAVNLYLRLKDYKKAEKFWLMAAQNNVTRAYYCLYVFYSEGKACESDVPKAIKYLEEGAGQDCRDCLYMLGRAYFEGKEVAKDDDRSRQLLTKASERGHGKARLFLDLMLNGGAEALQKEFKAIGEMLLATVPEPKAAQSSVRDPYALCSCRSGKKFKWCCMGKSTLEQPARSPLALHLPKFRK
jgi:TPR repeat protein